MHADILSGAVCDSEDSVHGLWIDSQVIYPIPTYMTLCAFILYYLQLLVIVYPYSYSLTDYCLVCSTLPHAFSLTLCREAEPLRFSPYLLKCLTAIARMGAKVDGRKQTRTEGVVFQAGLQVILLYLLGTGHSHSPVPRLPSAQVVEPTVW